MKSIGYKILQFPLTRILIGIIAIVIGYFVSQSITQTLISKSSFGDELYNIITELFPAIIAILIYILLFKYYERRRIDEFSLSGIAKELFAGTILGAVLQSLTIMVIYLIATYEVISVNSYWIILSAIALALSTAIFEEILLRGLLFRIIEQKLGSYIALTISALIFGLLHLLNPNSSIIVALGIAIQAGLLLGLAYMYTRRLWFPIALHFAWNFMQSGIFGANTSGKEKPESLFISEISGSIWITGGEFGPEGSIQATIFSLITSAILFFLCIKYNRIIKPFWKKTNNKPPTVYKRDEG